MRAVVFTLGCKVNEVESASIMSALEAKGFDVDDKLSYADIFVLNTCAVTREAEKKSRQLVSRARKFNKDAKIYVCGCASEKDKKAFEDKGVTFVSGAREKGKIVEAICGEKKLSPPKQTKSRAFIKIQDGCNNFCSYCIIPYLRGREVSRPISEILSEIESVSAPEIVLTGINISSFENFSELLEKLKDSDKRIRLGSLECSIIDKKFLETLRGLKNFAPQFHLSLQSGSNSVLKSMNRHYTREEYKDKCSLIYSYFPNAAITTDIIAGFATETEEDFLSSLSIIDEVGFARVHAFAYSPREGTNAYKLKDLPCDVKRKRLHSLLEKSDEAAKKFINKFIGASEEIIAEEFDGEFTSGYTSNYIRVYVEGKLTPPGKYSVKLQSLFRDGAKATLNGK